MGMPWNLTNFLCGNSLFQSRYRSEVESADFVKEGKAVEKRINSWVSGKTNNMIPKLLPENSLTPDTILVLLNAVYFKGQLEAQYDTFKANDVFRIA